MAINVQLIEPILSDFQSGLSFNRDAAPKITADVLTACEFFLLINTA